MAVQPEARSAAAGRSPHPDDHDRLRRTVDCDQHPGWSVPRERDHRRQPDDRASTTMRAAAARRGRRPARAGEAPRTTRHVRGTGAGTEAPRIGAGCTRPGGPAAPGDAGGRALTGGRGRADVLGAGPGTPRTQQLPQRRVRGRCGEQDGLLPLPDRSSITGPGDRRAAPCHQQQAAGDKHRNPPEPPPVGTAHRGHNCRCPEPTWHPQPPPTRPRPCPQRGRPST